MLSRESEDSSSADTVVPIISQPPSPHPQQREVDDHIRMLLQRRVFYEAQAATVQTTTHADAIIRGIFSEAVRLAKGRGATDLTTWRVALRAALVDLSTPLQEGEAVHPRACRVLTKLSALSLFGVNRTECGTYGSVHIAVQDIRRRQRELLTGVTLQKAQQTSLSLTS